MASAATVIGKLKAFEEEIEMRNTVRCCDQALAGSNRIKTFLTR